MAPPAVRAISAAPAYRLVLMPLFLPVTRRQMRGALSFTGPEPEAPDRLVIAGSVAHRGGFCQSCSIQPPAVPSTWGARSRDRDQQGTPARHQGAPPRRAVGRPPARVAALPPAARGRVEAVGAMKCRTIGAGGHRGPPTCRC